MIIPIQREDADDMTVVVSTTDRARYLCKKDLLISGKTLDRCP
ncbi:hypothetical protein CTP10_R47320 [Cupriavidus sp. P-10]|nr:hypothetical protein CTP10_R47320 [Cupriavidus sp. P-10]